MTLDNKLEPQDKQERHLFDLAKGIFDHRNGKEYEAQPEWKYQINRLNYQRFILSAYRYERDEWKNNYVSGIEEIYNFYTGGK